MIIGGDLGFENYRRALDVLVARTGARSVYFTGQISAEARDALYLRADVYLSMSAHEGFCAPLIEALAHGVPVVARGAGAVPETLGGAGLVLDGADPPLVAEALHDSSHRLRREARSRCCRPAPRRAEPQRACTACSVGARPAAGQPCNSRSAFEQISPVPENKDRAPRWASSRSKSERSLEFRACRRGQRSKEKRSSRSP